jgi:hypothetical protein
MTCQKDTVVKCTKECGGLTKNKKYKVITVRNCYDHSLTYGDADKTVYGGFVRIVNDVRRVVEYCASRFEVIGGAREENIHDGTTDGNDGKQEQA